MHIKFFFVSVFMNFYLFIFLWIKNFFFFLTHRSLQEFLCLQLCERHISVVFNWLIMSPSHHFHTHSATVGGGSFFNPPPQHHKFSISLCMCDNLFVHGLYLLSPLFIRCFNKGAVVGGKGSWQNKAFIGRRKSFKKKSREKTCP